MGRLMFIPEPFKVEAKDKLQIFSRLVTEAPFATLISYRNSDIYITKVPIIYRDSKIYGHLSTRNEHCLYLRDTLAKHTILIDGPHAFISPRSVGNRPNDIPTWNYISALVDSPVTTIENNNDIISVLSKQLEAYDGQDVSYLEPKEFSVIGSEIMAFSFSADEGNITVKQKLSQNKSDSDFENILKNLKEKGCKKLVEWMIASRHQ
ncbi:MAG: hypothetical protein EOP04_14095 [Proteobacteria bacterium]|nr:MAG: hypothetical protein EOP04_14095 [Pseudomonadota bacterium]